MTGDYLAIVLDPENDDPAYGNAEDAALRPFDLGYGCSGFNDSFEEMVDERENDVSLEELLTAAYNLVECADHTGCTPDVAVVDTEPLFVLKAMLKRLGSI